MTLHVKNLIRKLKCYYKNAKSKNSTQLWDKFRRFRDETTLAIRDSKEKYYSNLQKQSALGLSNLKVGGRF